MMRQQLLAKNKRQKEKRLAGKWQTEKFLSQAGEDLKVVAVTLPTYAMAYFVIPMAYTRIQIISSVWWADAMGNRECIEVLGFALTNHKLEGCLSFAFHDAWLATRSLWGMWSILQNEEDIVC